MSRSGSWLPTYKYLQYLLSANIKASTLENWILETIKKIEARAQEIVADKSEIQHRNPAEQEKMYTRCQSIVEHGFSLDGFMTDKSRSELNPLKHVLKELGLNNAYICLCQFHIIQAILNWDCDNVQDMCPFSNSAMLLYVGRLVRDKSRLLQGLEALLSGLVEENSDDGLSDGDSQTNNAPENVSKGRKLVPKPRTKEANVSGLTCYEICVCPDVAFMAPRKLIWAGRHPSAALALAVPQEFDFDQDTQIAGEGIRIMVQQWKRMWAYDVGKQAARGASSERKTVTCLPEH
ncbi:hypothetical protein DFH08DRAFT_811319 [Mycena albidolilacea]|uniref:Uncharacterized protein n=1 Tax=Mycena albidolilacea TaxID=1033008 RepID=A0AAD7EPR4_9AGAR|nr:hypothetical protein DFH08DRAFT_811319 [Mycena albidolilacea]